MRVELERFLGWAVLLRHPEDLRGYPNDSYWHGPTKQWTSLKDATLYHDPVEGTALAVTMAVRNRKVGTAVRVYDPFSEEPVV